jgi:hypothetical protein
LATVGRLIAMLHNGALMADAAQPWAASWLTALEQLVRSKSLVFNPVPSKIEVNEEIE